MFELRIVPSAMAEIRDIPVYYRREIEDEIDSHLARNPQRLSRHIKCLKGMTPGFEYVEPVWELRVGEWRVFYDVDDDKKTVFIRAVRRKEGGQTTQEIT